MLARPPKDDLRIPRSITRWTLRALVSLLNGAIALFFFLLISGRSLNHSVSAWIIGAAFTAGTQFLYKALGASAERLTDPDVPSFVSISPRRSRRGTRRV